MPVQYLDACFYNRLIGDGITVKIGQHRISEALVRCRLFNNKSAIGWRSKVTPGSIIRSVMEGIITGKFKTRDQGKAVATTVGDGTIEEKSFFHLNQLFEMRDIEYTYSSGIISLLDSIATVNNALEVDLTCRG